MHRRPLFIVALALVALFGCSPTNPLFSPPERALGSRIVRSDASRIRGSESVALGPYPLHIGNTWRYAGRSTRRENGIVVHEARWTRRSSLARHQEISGRTYVLAELAHQGEGERENHFVTWLRQDRQGLYEHGVPPLLPDSVTYPVPYEKCLLAYPLHSGREWTVDEALRVTAKIEGLVWLETPAGRFRAWKIRLRSGYHSPDEESYSWYSQEGLLGTEFFSKRTRLSPEGKAILVEDHRVEWIQSIELIRDPPGHLEVLASARMTVGATLRGIDRRLRPMFGYHPGNGAAARILFDETWIDSSSVGSILEATERSDPDFLGVAESLTNGVADELCLGTCEEIGCLSQCGSESRFFGLATSDLAGATIEKVSLQVDSVSFAEDPRAGDFARFDFTIVVHGVRDPRRP